MSLKALHIIFITASTLLAVGFSVWSFRHYYSPDGMRVDLGFGIGSALMAVVLVVYGRYFLKKLKNVSYL